MCIRDRDGVQDVHDLHVWTLTSGMEVASAHMAVRDGVEHAVVLARAREILADRYGLGHATIQVEPVRGRDGARNCRGEGVERIPVGRYTAQAHCPRRRAR